MTHVLQIFNNPNVYNKDDKYWNRIKLKLRLWSFKLFYCIIYSY